MTAVESYYDAIAHGQIPATVPVVSLDGKMAGIATQRVAVLGNPGAEHLALSSRRVDRAVAAVFACRLAVMSVQQKYEDVQPVVS